MAANKSHAALIEWCGSSAHLRDRGKDVLDPRAHPGDALVAPLLTSAQRTIARALALE